MAATLPSAAALTGAPGDPAEGAKIFKDTGLGNCLACHVNADMASDQFHGDVGPALDGVASRWDEPHLRAIVVNSKTVFTDETVMPGFYSLEVGKNVAEKFVGKTILTAQQVVATHPALLGCGEVGRSHCLGMTKRAPSIRHTRQSTLLDQLKQLRPIVVVVPA